MVSDPKMASNIAKQSYISGLIEPISKITNSSNRRKFLTKKIASLTDLIPKDFSTYLRLPPPVSLLGELHPSVRELAAGLVAYLVAGTLCFHAVLSDIKGNKENPVIDSLYFTVTTLTTVGYGDLRPNSTPVKALVCVFVFLGMGLMGFIMCKAADYIVEKQEILFVKALSEHGGGTAEKAGNEIDKKFFLGLAVLGGLMLVAIIFLYVVEELDFIDSIFCVCTTITTVGFGDKAFATAGGRFFAVLWILSTTFICGQLFKYLIELVTQSRQEPLVKWVLSRRMINLNWFVAEADHDAVVSAAEFAVYKLKEMGKISHEDITRLMSDFEDDARC